MFSSLIDFEYKLVFKDKIMNYYHPFYSILKVFFHINNKREIAFLK